MTEQQNGLRFDIYERVHLSEEATGIRQLEGVELVPHIQVLAQGDQAVLRGNLLLNGTYLDEQGRSDQVLEHLIPVEITLPANRVHRIEEISAAIDNFDVDLLSTRSLNITGVLSLNGLQLKTEASDEQWGEAEEEAVFVHQAEEAAPGETVRAAEAEEAAVLSAVEAQASERAEVKAAEQAAKNTAEQAPPKAEVEAPEQSKDQPLVSEAEAVEEHEANVNAPAETAPAGDKKEMKVALGAKKTDDAAQAEPPPSPVEAKKFNLKSILPSLGKKDGKRPEEDDSPELQADSAAAEPSSHGSEWKKLLLSSMNDSQPFKRVKLCIVQRDDTLETIAERYELNPREIALYNKLGDSGVSEGQVVYIPK